MSEKCTESGKSWGRKLDSQGRRKVEKHENFATVRSISQSKYNKGREPGLKGSDWAAILGRDKN